VKNNWNSLVELAKWLESTSTEKVKANHGFKLITDKAEYGLAFGQLHRRPHQESSKKTKSPRK
jgi:hypothetical protein